ncbi:MAG: GAF domain-containing sensor histidine kinase [Patescibacteria group bacterium]|nr:GAF domain-containing sensor histidine kinase [Patescibacteria group bacterium]
MENILEEIYKSGLKLLEPLTPEETYAIVGKEAKKLVQADDASIFLKQGKKLKRVYATSAVLYSFKQRKKGFVYQAYTSHKPLITKIEKMVKIHPQLEAAGMKSTMIIPLSYHKKSIGVLTVLSCKEKHFNNDKLKILSLFASMASMAIRKTQLYDETRKALKNRDLFISLAAHELRTPVATIFGYTQLLNTKSSGRNNTEAKWIKFLHAESYHLTLLIKELLEIERIKSGELQYVFRECSLKEIIYMAIQKIKLNYPDRKIIFEDLLNNPNDKIIGDFDKLLQVLNNLLENAAKFSSPDTQITIRLDSKPHNYVLRVIDQGKGISKKDLPKVFEGYYKKEDDTSKGMGLGLFLCKSIIEKHRGSIKIKSHPGKGTLVEVQLAKAKI